MCIEGSLIYPVPANPLYAEVSFKDTATTSFRCIHPDLGHSVAKYPKNSGLRTSLHSQIKRLQRMWQAAQAGDAGGEPSLAVCVYCLRDCHADDEMPPFTCPVCLLSLHTRCAALLLTDDHTLQKVHMWRARLSRDLVVAQTIYHHQPTSNRTRHTLPT
jgi:hypothetical protein